MKEIFLPLRTMTFFHYKLIVRSLAIIGLMAALVSCKSEFEQVRTSGDAEKIYDKSMEYYEMEDYSKAQTLMEIILSSYRGTEKGEDLYLKYAYSNYYQGLYISSANLFETFSTTFPSSDFREEADFMAAYSYYLLSPTYRLDQEYTDKAIESFQLFVNTFPTSDRVEESNKLIDDLRKKLEEKRLAQAELYRDLRQYEAAIQVLDNLLKDFPETKDAQELRFMIVESSYLLAVNSVYEKQKERYTKTNSFAEAFLKRYPESKHESEVQKYMEVSTKKLNEL